MNLLQAVTELSHRFGTCDYVRGGGGNTSVKDPDTLWVKPSGTTLSGMTPTTFVALDRTKIADLYDAQSPEDPSAREAMVKDMMAAALVADADARPSVEAPLHDSFQATFVVHTHPAVVNGMCCAADGRAAWETLFGGDTLWIDYIDPGYTLCMEVRRRLRAYRDEYGADPRAVFLANHGVFVPGETPAEVGATYEMIVETLSDAYDAVGLSVEPAVGPQPPDALVGRVGEQLQKALGDQAACIASGPAMAVPDGPLTPDHIVYAKAYPLIGEPTERAIEQFRRQHGYAPRVILMDEATLCVGTSPHQADLAMELAVDGAQVARLCHAFGGVRFMTDRARDFIENWEVEAYRRKQAQ